LGISRFLYDGARIHGTPETMGMEDGDVIEVASRQDGGSRILFL
jgi:hypothetical protein